ncbi:D,D-peptidase/D,D-carboxypeptidase VanY-N [Streptosporangium sp. NPDC050855]|uniref:D,D-peptidase/D,D-carboxypeptidase VanY-N n=1 Tax=Streptosporangium sp. NPDC050855 TaxID=3366194 RepID=UPI0037B2683B
MNESRTIPPRPRDRLYAVVTLVLAVLLLPAAFARHPGRALEVACRWALRTRFPAEDLTGLTDGALAVFTAARTRALWRHGQLIGLTSGYRDPLLQQRMFDEEVRRSGSPASARMLVLPPAESGHVKGIALDVRPHEGARWLEEHGARHDLYRMYDNEWWHFEYRPECAGVAPRRRPHPGVGHAGQDGARIKPGPGSAHGGHPGEVTGRHPGTGPMIRPAHRRARPGRPEAVAAGPRARPAARD